MSISRLQLPTARFLQEPLSAQGVASRARRRGGAADLNTTSAGLMNWSSVTFEIDNASSELVAPHAMSAVRTVCHERQQRLTCRCRGLWPRQLYRPHCHRPRLALG
eukprot:1921487-Rhodomonas_salina.1